MARKNITISVIMPVYNGVAFLEQSLAPLVAMFDAKEILEFIIIDDGSEDESVSLAEKYGAKILSSGGRKGPGAARNIASKQAQGDILWFIDADVIVRNDAVKTLQQGFINQQITAIFGSYDDAPPAQNFLSQYKNLLHHYHHQHANRNASTFWSGCGAIRKQDFLAIGGFDIEQFKYPSIEDIELGCRICATGGQILLLAKLQCTHLKIWKFINLVHTDFFRRAIPWSRLMLNQKQLTNDLNVGISERLRALLAIVFVLTIFAASLNIVIWWAPLASLFCTGLANIQLMYFFYHRKGMIFTFGCLLYHQFYYLYSTTAFLYALVEKIQHYKKV